MATRVLQGFQFFYPAVIFGQAGARKPDTHSHLFWKDAVKFLIAPRALATSGRRPGVRAKRAARGVAGHHVWTGTHETRQSHNSDAERYWTSTSQDKLIT